MTKPSPIQYFIWNSACFAYLPSNTNWHYHPGIQMYYSPGNKLTVELKNKQSIEGMLVAVPSHCIRRVQSANPIIQFTYHPYIVDELKIVYIDRIQSVSITEDLTTIAGLFLKAPSALHALHLQQILSMRLLEITTIKTMRIQVQSAFAKLSNDYNETLDINALSQQANLSPSRLQHLFKEQIGTSLSRYQQWLRLRMSFQLISQGAPPLAAALEAGFTDQPHFSKLFKRSFGYSPNQLLKHYGDAKINVMEAMRY